MSVAVERMFDTHAHIMSADKVKYPPSEEGKDSKTEAYMVEQLLSDMDANGVASACAVQRFHYYHVDNSYILDASLPHTDRLSAVVMLDGQDPTSPAQLKQMASRQPIGALRFATTHLSKYDTAWMNAPSTVRLWEGAAKLKLPVCIIFYLRHLPYNLPALAMIAEMFPETPIVIDHLGVPHAPIAFLDQLREGRPAPYIGPPDYGITPALKELRAHRNVHFKLTGINLEYLEAHKVEAAPFVRCFVTTFGADRVMCGSDVGQTRGPYAKLISELRQSLTLLDAAERAAILWDNATKLFGPSLTRAA